MARKKEFDPHILLEDAMHIFWRNGYTATSMDDLVAGTQVQRYGIYASYKNKHGLLLAALDIYRDKLLESNLAPLTRPDAGLAEIRSVIETTAGYQTADAESKGCLMCNTAIELAASDPAVAMRAASYSDTLTELFLAALQNAQASGDLAETADVEQLANFLTGVLVGLNLFVRVTPSRAAVNAYIQQALACLDNPA